MMDHLEKQKSYLLLTTKNYEHIANQPQQVVNLFNLQSAHPLFINEPFAKLIQYSPWLIPSYEQLSKQQLKQYSHLKLGILLTSPQPFIAVLAHLQSLLLVKYQDKPCLFRFYDPLVLLPLLMQFSKTEIQLLLGNNTSISLWNEKDDLWLTFKKNFAKALEHSVSPAPWYQLNEQYFHIWYNLKVHASNLERRLWQLFHPIMKTKHTVITALIMQALLDAQKNNKSPQDAELYVLAMLDKQKLVSKKNLIAKFKLSEQQINILTQY